MLRRAPDTSPGGAMAEPDHLYFARRAAEEGELASTSRDPDVARIHALLAIKYEELADEARRRRPGDEDRG